MVSTAIGGHACVETTEFIHNRRSVQVGAVPAAPQARISCGCIDATEYKE